MAINFPNSPSLNETYTFGGVTYVWDGTRWRQRNADYVLLNNVEDQLITGGANITAKQLTAGNVTIDCGARPLQYISNAGAFIITAPAADGYCLLLIENVTGAGAVTFSGFSVGSLVGDALTTLVGAKFLVTIWRINGVSGYRVSSVGYVGPGDIVSGAVAWWGLRGYRAANIGTKCVRLRRNNDNVQQDFNVALNGMVDTAAIRAFAGVATLTVMILYDQAGSGRDQSLGFGDVRLVFTGPGGANPTMQFDGTSELGILTFPSTSQPFTMSAVALRSSVAAYSTVLAGGTGGGTTAALYFTSSGNVQLFLNPISPAALLNSGGNAENAWHAIQGVANSPNCVLDVDGTSVTGDAGTGTVGAEVIIGDDCTEGDYITGKIVEAGIWPSAFTATQIANINANQRAFWGF